MIRTLFLTMGFWLIAIGLTNAQSLRIEDCYQMARSNYPAIKKMDLIAKTSDYDLQNANKRFLPQLSFSGKATYQSEVVDYGGLLGGAMLPPGFNPPSLSKDQYSVQGEVSQLIYDGGNTKNQKELIRANAALQQQNVESNLYTINNRINTLFFSTLLMDAQLKQNQLNKATLQSQIQKMEAALQNGVAFRSNLDELKAEIANMDMAATEYRANRRAFLKMLSLFIGKDLNEQTQLLLPEPPPSAFAIQRPELQVFDRQHSMFKAQLNGLKTGYLPQISGFFQGAYGKPTLNILENKFGPWYITGIRFNWSLGSLYSLTNRKNALRLSEQAVEADRETFLLNTRIELSQQEENVKKYNDLIQQDEEAIDLRASVTKSAEAQLANGVITTHEYIQKVNAEHLARQNKIVHEILLLQAKYNQKFISGN